MRSVIAYILLVAIMLPTLSPWGTIAYFKLNREYIAKVLCENRKRPELHCDGKCYLAKKLKQQQEIDTALQQTNVLHAIQDIHGMEMTAYLIARQQKPHATMAQTTTATATQMFILFLLSAVFQNV